MNVWLFIAILTRWYALWFGLFKCLRRDRIEPIVLLNIDANSDIDFDRSDHSLRSSSSDQILLLICYTDIMIFNDI